MADERPLQQPDVNTSGCWFIAPSKAAEPTADSLFWLIADMRLAEKVIARAIIYPTAVPSAPAPARSIRWPWPVPPTR
jgi:hypothetical protein